MQNRILVNTRNILAVVTAIKWFVVTMTKYTKPVKIYGGEEPIKKFMREMLLEVEYCQKIAAAKFNEPLRKTDDDQPDFKQAKECHICGSKYGEKDIRVRDHCHTTGKYRRSAHQDCNLKLRINPRHEDSCYLS